MRMWWRFLDKAEEIFPEGHKEYPRWQVWLLFISYTLMTLALWGASVRVFWLVISEATVQWTTATVVILLMMLASLWFFVVARHWKIVLFQKSQNV